MQNSKFALLTSLLVLLLLGCDSDNSKSPPGPGHSSSIEHSKSNGVFKFEVVCNKRTFLLDTLYKCSIVKAWVENRWNKQAMMSGKPKIEKFDNAYQLIIQLNIDSIYLKSKNNCFYFIGHHLLDNLVHYRCESNNIDTIKIPIYRQIDSEAKERKTLDTLIFIKSIGI